MAMTRSGARNESLRASAQNASNTGWAGVSPASSSPGCMKRRRTESERTSVADTRRMGASLLRLWAASLRRRWGVLHAA